MILVMLIIMMVGAFVLLYHVTLEINKMDAAVRGLAEAIRNRYERRPSTRPD